MTSSCPAPRQRLGLLRLVPSLARPPAPVPCSAAALLPAPPSTPRGSRSAVFAAGSLSGASPWFPEARSRGWAQGPLRCLLKKFLRGLVVCLCKDSAQEGAMPKQAWDLDPARAASFPAVGPS